MRLGFPESIFQGGGAGAGGEEGDRGDFEVVERLESPGHHDVNDGDDGFWRIITKLGGEEVVKVLREVVVDGLERVGAWLRWREGEGRDLLDAEERVVVERGGEGGGEVGGNDQIHLHVSGDEVLAEFNGGEKMALSHEGHHPNVDRHHG